MTTEMFSPTRTSIKEANEHLQQLYGRVAELEKTVQEQAESLIKKDEQMQTRLKEVTQEKDSEIAELRRSLEASEAHVQKLVASLKERDATMHHLQHKCQLLEDISQYKPMLEGLLARVVEAEQLGESDYNRRVSNGGTPNAHHTQVYQNSMDMDNSPSSSNRHFSISEEEDGGLT
ncbi:PREDICTED: vimentin-type intermediate filament-associated coiled-coil protein-like [Branchiostoma belcheri]|uniref:Vimentin-type intermediate filament-associated coiled-coil protein-like n=1 Tax=Branchiostoma belcheri TaxID=7741 RepID=A0A6P5A811_BRABE|nr:PREDICTED: vimentin-type intermediate filament-associated coiled-coil protein-like [Branchiostoma belcheri]